MLASRRNVGVNRVLTRSVQWFNYNRWEKASHQKRFILFAFMSDNRSMEDCVREWRLGSGIIHNDCFVAKGFHLHPVIQHFTRFLVVVQHHHWSVCQIMYHRFVLLDIIKNGQLETSQCKTDCLLRVVFRIHLITHSIFPPLAEHEGKHLSIVSGARDTLFRRVVGQFAGNDKGNQLQAVQYCWNGEHAFAITIIGIIWNLLLRKQWILVIVM